MSDVFGGGSQTVQTQQQSAPWSGVQPYLQDAFARAQGIMGQGPSGYQTGAARMFAQSAYDPNSLSNQAQGSIGKFLDPNFLNPQTNPTFSKSVADALGQAGTAFAGQYGGAAGTNLGNSGYQESLARGLGNVATNAYTNQYNNNVGHQMAAAGMAPQLQYANATGLNQAGQIDNQAMWGPLQNYIAAISGQPGGMSNNQTPYFTNPLASAMGIGLGGLGIYNGGARAGLWGGTGSGLGVGSSALGGGGGVMAGLDLGADPIISALGMLSL